MIRVKRSKSELKRVVLGGSLNAALAAAAESGYAVNVYTVYTKLIPTKSEGCKVISVLVSDANRVIRAI
jgi:hypothetical protein